MAEKENRVKATGKRYDIKENWPKISVATYPNGYSLKFDGMKKKDGFFYLTKEKLLEGFMLHIGLEMTDQLDTETMTDFIIAACNWNENKKCLDEIDRLNLEVKTLRGRCNALATRLMNERNRHIALADDVTAMKKQFKGITDVGKAVDKIMRLHQRLVKLNLNHLISADIDEDDDGEG
jgi:hypothetical protein